MKKEEARLALLHRVASLFYLEGKRKKEIAQIIDVSAPQVELLLKEAKRKRIVEIKVNVPHLKVLQEKMRSRFQHLREVIVIPDERDTKLLLNNLSQTAAEYFDDNVSESARIAIGGGYLMYDLVSKLPERTRDIHIYPGAIVGRGPTVLHIDPIVVATLLWTKSGHLPGRVHYVTVTPPGRTRREVQAYYRQLRKNDDIVSLLRAMSDVDWLFASVGGVNADEAYVSATKHQTRNLLDELKFDDREMKQEGVIGDIVYSFFDENGGSKPTWDVVASLGVEKLRTMSADSKKRVVLVVGGYKLQAIKAVLRGRLCNVLITDSLAAEAVLNE